MKGIEVMTIRELSKVLNITETIAIKTITTEMKPELLRCIPGTTLSIIENEYLDAEIESINYASDVFTIWLNLR